MSDPIPQKDMTQNDKGLVLDELDEKFRAFQELCKSDSNAAADILDTIGAQDDVDRDIVLELSSRRPLAIPIVFLKVML